MPINTQLTGAAIAAHRQHLNMSQQALAGLMNVTHQAVSKWEKGLALPDTETLLALAKLFDTSMEDLLLGRMPVPKADETPSSAEQPSSQPETESDPSVDPNDKLRFASIMNMLPFVSRETADRLFLMCAQKDLLDAGQLTAIAPFVSTATLADYVSSHPLQDANPELICSLAPFLPAQAVDDLIHGLKPPVPVHVMNMLIPFASSKAIDQMVLGQLGMQWDAAEAATETDAAKERNEHSSVTGQRFQDRIHRRILRKLGALGVSSSSQTLPEDTKKDAAPAAAGARRESPRMRLIRKAIETGNVDLIAEHADEIEPDEQKQLAGLLMDHGMHHVVADIFDELDEGARHELLARAAETSNAELISLFCGMADKLLPDELETLTDLLMSHSMYDKLADLIDELDLEQQHKLLDRAFESNDPRLIRLISERLS